MKIIVTIPAFNEEKSIGSVIKKIQNVMGKGRYNYKILVVDDGSTDKTANVAKKNGRCCLLPPKKLWIGRGFYL